MTEKLKFDGCFKYNIGNGLFCRCLLSHLILAKVEELLTDLKNIKGNKYNNLYIWFQLTMFKNFRQCKYVTKEKTMALLENLEIKRAQVGKKCKLYLIKLKSEV